MILQFLVSAALHCLAGCAAFSRGGRAAASSALGASRLSGLEDLLYNEVTVEQSTGGSYFMACGWNTGYFGMQELRSPTNKIVIFSVWDPTKGDDANKVPLEQRVEVLHEGTGVKVSRFGGEGTGGKSMWPYLWETNEVCRFAVKATMEGDKASYAGWFFDNRAKAWKHLVTFRTRTGGKPLRGYYSFIEDFRRDGRSVNDVRRARFGNGWVRSTKGEWISLSRANFTASSAEWEAKENIDAGISRGLFYLATGGSTVRTHELRKLIELPVVQSAQPPELPNPLAINDDCASMLNGIALESLTRSLFCFLFARHSELTAEHLRRSTCKSSLHGSVGSRLVATQARIIFLWPSPRQRSVLGHGWSFTG